MTRECPVQVLPAEFPMRTLSLLPQPKLNAPKLCAPEPRACRASQTSEKAGPGFSEHVTASKHQGLCSCLVRERFGRLIFFPFAKGKKRCLALYSCFRRIKI